MNVVAPARISVRTSVRSSASLNQRSSIPYPFIPSSLHPFIPSSLHPFPPSSPPFSPRRMYETARATFAFKGCSVSRSRWGNGMGVRGGCSARNAGQFSSFHRSRSSPRASRRCRKSLDQSAPLRILGLPDMGGIEQDGIADPKIFPGNAIEGGVEIVSKGKIALVGPRSGRKGIGEKIVIEIDSGDLLENGSSQRTLAAAGHPHHQDEPWW